jgi:hypothetical protein
MIPPDLPIGMVVGDGDDLRAGLFADPDLSDYVQIVDYRAVLEPPAGDKELPLSLHLQEQSFEAETAENTGDDLLAGEVVPQ